MLKVNVASCVLDEALERGEVRFAYSPLTERLGATVMGATVYELQAGDKGWPYHCHYGIEEWLYVISGAPLLRDPSGERTLEPGALVAFRSGPAGAHTVHGPGRIAVFSAGASGWGEAFVTVYPDSDKIAAAPGVMFRRGDALASWGAAATERSGFLDSVRQPQSGQSAPAVNVMSIAFEPMSGGRPIRGSADPGMTLGPLLGAQTFAATLFELAPGEGTAPYHYEFCREEWVLVLSGAPMLRRAAGEELLEPGDVVCCPEGPTGARRLLNSSDDTVRLVLFSTPTDRPTSAFYPDDGTVLIRVSDHEGFLFRLADQVADYWDGEPGAGTA